MAVKPKISKIKHTNQKRGKPKTAGVSLKKKSKTPSKTKNSHAKKKVAPVVKKHDDIQEENDIGDMLDMVDEDEIEYMKSIITNRSYSFLNKIRYTESNKKSKRRKLNADVNETLEENYEDINADVPNVKFKPLLPIKTKDGIVPRSVVDESAEDSEDNDSESNSVDVEDESASKEPLTTAQLVAGRNEILRKKKIEIGSLSAGLLETPEEKMGNLGLLLKIMDEKLPEVYLSVRKLATVSLLEVFKDLLPSYQIKPQVNDGVKLKKDTLKLQKYEEALTQYYKKYLQKLEKLAEQLVRKRGDHRVRTKEGLQLGELGVKCLADLLVAHPYFNFSQNIAQAVVPFLNHSNKTVREIVKIACIAVFKEDKKEEITLKILRVINHYMKSHAHNVHVEMLEVLLVLKIKDVNLDQEKELEIKEKKLMARKQNVIQMSKRERKRKKRLQQLEKELLETKAEENKQTKQQNLTEITKIVFGIYFRILKSSTNTKILGVCLEGLAKYAHCINLEYYVDLVNVLDKLLKEDWLGCRERLHCIQTVFTILGGQGEVLNIDPLRFYTNLYKEMLSVHAGRSLTNFPVLLHTITNALIKRRKRITSKRVIGFVKRLGTLSMQLPHGESLSCLGVIKVLMQLNKAVDILLDLDASTGDGKFQAEIDDPEYCNASSSALFELVTLHRHYHPTVSKYAKYIAAGVPTNGETSLPPQLNKFSPEQLLQEFDMSKMAFNPPVSVPKKAQQKTKLRHSFVDPDFEVECNDILKRNRDGGQSFFIDIDQLKYVR